MGSIFANGVKKWLAQVDADEKATSEKDHGRALNQSPQSDSEATIHQAGEDVYVPAARDSDQDHLTYARLFKEVTSGTVSNSALEHFLFHFEWLYLRLDPMQMSGRVIPWVQSSGYGKSYTAFSLGKVMPCFLITLGPVSGDSNILPHPDDKIIAWLWQNKNVATPKLVLGVLVGAIHKHLFSYCVEEFSDGQVKVSVPAPYSPAKAREIVDEALLRVKQYAKHASAAELLSIVYNLNTVDSSSRSYTARHLFIDQVIDEASLLLKYAKRQEEEAGKYLTTLNIEHSITAFMTLVVLTRDSLQVRFSDNSNKWKGYHHEARPMQCALIIDDCSYLNQIFFPKEEGSKGVHALRGVYNDLLLLSKKAIRLDETDGHTLPSDASASSPALEKPSLPITEAEILLQEKPFDRTWLILVDRDIDERMPSVHRDYPIYHAFGRDHNVDLRQIGTRTVKELHSITNHLKHYGRGTWSRFQSMDVLRFAASKICGNKTQFLDEATTPEEMQDESLFADKAIDRNAKVDPLIFAVASYILGLDDGMVGCAVKQGEAADDITSEEASDIYSTQVAGHMRTVLEPGSTRSLPEPMLSIAAMMLVAYGPDVLGDVKTTTYKKQTIARAHLLQSISRLVKANYAQKSKVVKFYARTILTSAMIECFPDQYCPAKSSQAHYTTVRKFMSTLHGTKAAKTFLQETNDTNMEQSADSRDVGEGIINFHQWVPLTDAQDVIEKERKKVDLDVDFLHVMFQRLCAIILDDEEDEKKPGAVTLIIPALFPPKGMKKGTPLEDLPYSQCKMRFIAVSTGPASLKDAIRFPLISGSDEPTPLFSISMDLANEGTFEEEIEDLKEEESVSSNDTHATASPDKQTVGRQEVGSSLFNTQASELEHESMPDATWDGDEFRIFPRREISEKEDKRRPLTVLASGLSTKVFPCLDMSSVGVDANSILKGIQTGFEIREFIGYQADTFTNKALVEQWKGHTKSFQAQFEKQEEEEDLEMMEAN